MAPALRFAKTGDVVIAAVGETVEESARPLPGWVMSDVAIHDDSFLSGTALNPKFVSYFLQTSRVSVLRRPSTSRAPR